MMSIRYIDQLPTLLLVIINFSMLYCSVEWCTHL